MNKLTLIALLLLSLPAFSQRDTLLGRVSISGGGARGIFVINKNTGAEVKTGDGGLFKVPARNGDRLVVYSDATIVREFYISKESFTGMPYDLEVEAKPYMLDEVVIDKNITSESLGLVPENQKRYTVAERRLKTAGEFKPTFLFFLGGGLAMPLDPLINAISGRTRMLKKELATERKQMGMESIDNIYTEEQLVSELAIPAEKTQAFLYFAVEDTELMRAIKNKNTERAKLELSVLAARYLDMQMEESQSQSQSQSQQASDPQPPTSDPQPPITNNQQPATNNPQPATHNQKNEN